MLGQGGEGLGLTPGLSTAGGGRGEMMYVDGEERGVAGGREYIGVEGGEREYMGVGGGKRMGVRDGDQGGGDDATPTGLGGRGGRRESQRAVAKWGMLLLSC